MNTPLKTLITTLVCFAACPYNEAARPRLDKPLSPDDAHYLNQPVKPALPTLFIIGDSTVRNGNGTGKNGQRGWGDCLAVYFDTSKINIVNDALGGTSSRTFYRDRWPGVKAMMKPGDIVIMQFGHNDASPINEDHVDEDTRARGTIDGTGPETMVVTNILTTRIEVVHSYGWYLTQYIAETRAHGATPLVCSPIPRNKWEDGRFRRNKADYADWAEETARMNDALFLGINHLISDRYDEMGEEKISGLFAPDAVHTTEAGAQLNASCVLSALKNLEMNPLAPYILD